MYLAFLSYTHLWVYSCINCHNSLETLKGWYGKYREQGFEIVGVHTPEFESDRVAASVKADLLENNVTWPVVQAKRWVADRPHGAGWPARRPSP